MADVVCLDDLEERARRNLPEFALAFYATGAMEEDTLRENRNAYKRLRIHPRVLRGISCVDTSTTVLGQAISMPIGISPTALHHFAHPEGETATAKAAQAAGTVMTVSCYASCKFEDITSAASNCLLWLNMKILVDRGANIKLLKKAEACGWKAVVITVDGITPGRRFRSMRSKSEIAKNMKFPNFDFDKNYKSGAVSFAKTNEMIETTIDWSIVSWLRSVTRLPIILKGILTADDAREAVVRGIDGIFVSNHGGRQLDTVPATIDVLPEIVEAVQGRAEVYLDGGVRLGTDVFKALALGARAVFVGRPALWGLASQGEQGVLKMLELLGEEFRVAMILAGCGSLADIKPTMVSNASPYSRL